MNGLTLLALIALAIGIVIAYRAGIARGRRAARAEAPHPLAVTANVAPAPTASTVPASPAPAVPAPAARSPDAGLSPAPVISPTLDDERSRLVRAYEAEVAALRRAAVNAEAERSRLREFAEDRRALHAALADSRAETARYRQLVVDLENNAPSRFLDGPGSPDDLKLIVGVGPVLERMLHQLGVTTYRQIARWSDRDIDDFDRRLPEFPGRIRRDAWVIQARELHHSKYGTSP